MKLFKPRYPYLFALSLIILVELLSFLAYFYPGIQLYLLALSLLAVFILSLYSLEAGLLLALIELVVGSKGHLFSAEIFAFPVSLRLMIWSALLLASLVYFYRQGFINTWHKKIKVYEFWPWLGALVIFIAFAVLRGLLFSPSWSLVLADVNAWLYLALIIPLLLAYNPGDRNQASRLKKYFLLAVLWLSFKTLFLLFVFSHNLVIMPDLYLWVRRSGIGEITAMGGGWFRIFIQSQIYLPIALFLVLFPAVKAKIGSRAQLFRLVFLLAIFLAVIVISMSRSFWLALGVSGLIAAVVSWRLAWSLYFKALAYILVSALMAMLIIFVVIKFPLPGNNYDVRFTALSERLEVNTDEAALASRWSLLPNLWQAIKKDPILGQGFGASVSYYSQDPRVLANNPDGWYTTYAFEWAYLDTWLKIGILGTLAFVSWLIYLIIALWQYSRSQKSELYFALAASLLFLMIVNIFTPYLNHPLGLGFLLFSSCFFRKNSL
ncbi:MAG: O-antigen ligase family protein [Patescibacteria group bacterium]|nr:O-antigen ligase family protein [Patescibacteria group bacterium]